MKTFLVRVTAAHIAGVASAGYGPRIIIAALKDRLMPDVFVMVDKCWLTVVHRGQRTYIHLPLHMLPYTFRMNRTPLLLPMTFRMELPTGMVQRAPRAPRKSAA